MRYIVLDIGCAECVGDVPDDLVSVIGYAETEDEVNEVTLGSYTLSRVREETTSGWCYLIGSQGGIFIIDTLKEHK